MEIADFINIFIESFDEIETEINADTVYKEIDEWTSMQALLLIAHVDDTLNVVLDADSIKDTKTVEDLFLLVKKDA